MRNIALVTTSVANGDLSKQITVEAKGEILELKDTINTMVDQLRAFASEVTRVAREVGTEGNLGAQADVKGVAGTWKDLTDHVNVLAGNLTNQVRNIALVTTAVANGDLSQKITVKAKGEVAELKNTINTMVDQLRAFASEVTRVAREVGTEGKLGAQAEVAGVSGTWKDLTDNVNFLAGNLTSQVRNIAAVTTAVAKGDLSKKITVEARGEILELKNTINVMVDQLNSFAAEVTRVAREVGTEGKLGAQAVSTTITSAACSAAASIIRRRSGVARRPGDGPCRCCWRQQGGQARLSRAAAGPARARGTPAAPGGRRSVRGNRPRPRRASASGQRARPASSSGGRAARPAPGRRSTASPASRPGPR